MRTPGRIRRPRRRLPSTRNRAWTAQAAGSGGACIDGPPERGRYPVGSGDSLLAGLTVGLVRAGVMRQGVPAGWDGVRSTRSLMPSICFRTITKTPNPMNGRVYFVQG